MIDLYGRAREEVDREIDAAVTLLGREVVYPSGKLSFGPDPEQVWGMSETEIREAVVSIRRRRARTWRRKERRELAWMLVLLETRDAAASGLEIVWR